MAPDTVFCWISRRVSLACSTSLTRLNFYLELQRNSRRNADSSLVRWPYRAHKKWRVKAALMMEGLILGSCKTVPSKRLSVDHDLLSDRHPLIGFSRVMNQRCASVEDAPHRQDRKKERVRAFVVKQKAPALVHQTPGQRCRRDFAIGRGRDFKRP